MRHLWIVLAVCVSVWPSWAADRMSVDEAVKLIPDAGRMHRDRETKAAVIEAFKELPPDQVPQAAEKLLGLLTVVDNVESRIPLQAAVANVGDACLPGLAAAVEKDLAWDNVAHLLPRFSVRALPPLTELLGRPTPKTRLRAAMLLEMSLGHPGWAVRRAEAKAALPTVAQALAQRLRDESSDVSVAAARALAAMGVHGTPAAEALLSAAASPDAALRAAALGALATQGREQPVAPSALLKALDDRDEDVRLAAAQGLADLGEAALDESVKALRGGSDMQRRLAAFAIGRMGNKAARAAEALTGALTDKEDAVRRNAVDALARVADKTATPVVRKTLDDPSPVVRCAAAAALAVLAPDDTEALKAAQETRRQLASAAKPRSFEPPPCVSPAKDCLIGGPLEGVPLPKYPSQHGAPAGYPGCVPAIQKPEGEGDQQRIPFTPEAQQPEPHLYADAVEHWRTYWMKYNPVRSTFDAQSQVRNFPAKDLPGVAANQVETYEEPVYWVPRHSPPRNTGLKNPAVPVVRCRPGSPVFRLDFGALPIGLYAVRVIGAVETASLERIRRSLYLALKVNDGLNGEENMYKVRCGYQDEFYSVAEIYFHAPEKRAYRAELRVVEGSRVDLLAHNISLDNALVGIERRPVKTAMTRGAPDERAQVRAAKAREFEAARKGAKWTASPPRVVEEQWARDRMLWAMWPRINAQPGSTYGAPPNAAYGTGGVASDKWGEEQQDAARRWGKWSSAWPHGAFRRDAPLRELEPGLSLLSNSALNLRYAVADHAAGKALPDPYPFKDDGTGLVFAAPKPGDTPHLFNPVAGAVGARINDYRNAVEQLSREYHETGNMHAGRDAAIMLVRMAYDTPSIDAANSLSSLVADPGPWNRDLRCRRRETVAYWAPSPALYDRLFDVIQGNEELAASVSRFIPWVGSSADVISLLDAYLVQDYARRVLRYQLMWDNAPTLIVAPAVILGDRELTRPWMEWLWSKAYIYPNPTSGLPDLITTANDRDGVGYIASWSYCQGEEASCNGDNLAAYIAAGGDPKYDLRDPKLYPKVTDACYWPLRTLMAGLYWPRVGDVAGPDKPYAYQFNEFQQKMRRGWAWTRDPVCAWMIRHHYGRRGESDAEWAQIEEAAKAVKRAPYLTQPSRVVANWCAVLESGREHDDPRFRRAVMLRVGQGVGHAHNDTLDLQVHAHGYPFTIDDGQRPGYTAGGSASTRYHNMVQVDDKNWMGYAWTPMLSDAPGARFVAAEAVPPDNLGHVKLLRRDVALIDVDEGRGSGPVAPEGCLRGVGLPKDVVTANSYVVDVVRVAGGKKHTYCFHGPIDDELMAQVDNRTPSDKGKRDGFEHSGRGFTGVAPDPLVAAWRMRREPLGIALCEKGMAPWFDPHSPAKYTRLHLFGQKGAAVSTDWCFCKQWNYGFTNLYASREAEADLESVFAAVIEPYVGEPFIAGGQLLPVEPNETGVRQATALEVKTKNGHTDLTFVDPAPARVRRAGDCAFTAAFGFVSRDADGLRLATLTGGILLETPWFTVRPAKAEYAARITGVDYPGKTFITDAPLAPLKSGERAIEVLSGRRPAAFMAAEVRPDAVGSRVRLLRTAGIYASRITDTDAATNTVYCALPFPYPTPDRERGMVASNRDLTKFWRTDYLGGLAGEGRFGFRLDGPAAAADFGPSQSLRVWEYGVGDTVRHATSVTLRRTDAKSYELIADIEVEVVPRTPGVRIAVEGRDRNQAAAREAEDRAGVVLRLEDLSPDGRAMLRIEGPSAPLVARTAQ